MNSFMHCNELVMPFYWKPREANETIKIILIDFVWAGQGSKHCVMTQKIVCVAGEKKIYALD